VWILKNGTPSAVRVVVGVSDGQRTEIVKGDIKEEQDVIVDSDTKQAAENRAKGGG
jgi:HlyD family secretion protein